MGKYNKPSRHKDWQYTAKRGVMYYVKMEKKNARRKGKSSGHSDAKMLLSWVKGENMWVLVIRYGPQAKFFPVFLGV